MNPAEFMSEIEWRPVFCLENSVSLLKENKKKLTTSKSIQFLPFDSVTHV